MKLPQIPYNDLGTRYFGSTPSRYVAAMLRISVALQQMLVNDLSVDGTDLPEEARREAAAWRTRVRVKAFDRIIEKAQRRGIQTKNIDDLELQIGDIVGAKVLLPYWEDVYNVGEMINSNGREWNLCKKVEDYVGYKRVRAYSRRGPQSTGYRALHFGVTLDVGEHKNVPCEIQVKTDAFDSWAERTHDLIYKGGEVPEVLRTFARHQAECIYKTDIALELIKKEIMNLHKDPNGRQKKKKGRG